MVDPHFSSYTCADFIRSAACCICKRGAEEVDRTLFNCVWSLTVSLGLVYRMKWPFDYVEAIILH